MENVTWKHFEFQSENGGKKDLKRFRTYEALTSYQYNIEVTTYVLYSGKIKNPMVSYTEGINTYQVIPIIMQNKDADELLIRLQEKIKEGSLIQKEDIVPLSVCFLMGGKSSLKDRAKKACKIIRSAEHICPVDIQKIEAVLYIMAEKFLDSLSMEEFREDMRMTKLGQMLVNDGKKEERENGLKILVRFCRKLNISKEDTKEKIADEYQISKEDADMYVEKFWQ